MSFQDLIEVTELPESFLQHSRTWEKYHHTMGMCSLCHEPTDLLFPCCDVKVIFEGSSISADELWNDIEKELREYCEAKFEANDKMEKEDL